jgi:hypothetical protein
MSHDAVRAALAATPTSVDDAVSIMEALAAALPPTDGVACFNRLYLETTKNVREAIVGAVFEDAAFLTRLDVVFANLYFDALRSDLAAPRTAPRAWEALLCHRARPRTHPLQFALAGMNAHINFDLPRALLLTTRELGGTVAAGTPRHRDFESVNKVLAQTEAAVKKLFLQGALSQIDDALGDVDDRVALWSIAKARDAAWTQGETLWFVRGTPLEGALVTTLDRTVSLIGAALVV